MDLQPLLALPAVRTARSSIVASAAETLDEQLRIVAIPAPSFAEEARASYVLERFRGFGIADASFDGVGNVLAVLPGASSGPTEPLVVAAHLDTVFPAGTDLTPRHVGRKIFAPGIADNARGLAALLTLGRVLVGASVRTQRPVLLVATVGEEGIGDLRGVKHLFDSGAGRAGVGGFIALDGSGVRRIVHRAIGACRLRATIRGPGGHSWSDWGNANPADAVARAIVELRRIHLPAAHRTTLTVTRIGGGTSVNAIPEEAWLEIDLRSEEPRGIRTVETEVRRVLRTAVTRESAARRPASAPLSLRIERIGDRPSGSVSPHDPLVSAALEATRAVGARPELAASSTDANVPLSLGIPAITIGAGGESGGIHTLEEWYADEGGTRGLDRALLTVLAAAGAHAVG